MLSDSYFRRIAWMGTPISQEDYLAMLERVFAKEYPDGDDATPLLELASVFGVLALGVVMDMEREPLDRQATNYVILAHTSLFAARYMIIDSLTCLEALVIFD
jgi:hypothetical protein